MFVLLMIFSFSNSLSADQLKWSTEQKLEYDRRDFIALQHDLILKKQSRLVKFIQSQSEDLEGCKKLHSGVGNVASLIECMRFINREFELKLYSNGRQDLIND